VKVHFGETPKSTPETGALPGSKPLRRSVDLGLDGYFLAAPAAICCFFDFAGIFKFRKK
jgi:hypothetical protein